MAYQTALTIESVIKDIDAKKYLLPSIQREFVWSTKQIEKLFDSLMMDYPINAFPNPDQLKVYKEKHFIPDVDLSFGNFEEFLGAREELIVEALKKELM